MISRSTTQQHLTHQSGHFLEDATAYLVALRSKEELSIRHWVCVGCETVHTGIFPEECENCGATALEFAYSATQQSH